MEHQVLYVSGCSLKNLWQEYRIYADHVEFDTLFGQITVPFSQIEQITLAHSDVKGLLNGHLQLKQFKPALKLDMANFTDHIVIDKSSGNIQRLLFTPENPEEFAEALEKALQAYKNRDFSET